MREAPFGECLRAVKDEVILQDAETYKTVGVLSYGKGLFERPSVKGSQTTYRSYFRIRAGQFVYSKLFAWEGALAVVPPKFDGWFVSSEFPTFDIDTAAALPAYVRLLCRWEPVWQRLRAGETGMGGRRKRVHPTHLIRVNVPLPAVAEQLRIADLAQALDESVTAAEEEERAARTALQRWCSEVLVSEGSSRTRAFGEISTLYSGQSWSSQQERMAPDGDTVSVVKITNTRPNGTLDMTERLWVTGLPTTARRITESTVLLIRTNGNRQRIGNAYLATPESVGSAYSAFQIGAFFDTRGDAEYACYVLRSEDVQRRISEAASGSTGLGNIAVGWLRRLELPWPDAEQRARRAAQCRDIEAVLNRAAAVADGLRHLRSAVLTDLLTGRHEIPGSYDRLMETVA